MCSSVCIDYHLQKSFNTSWKFFIFPRLLSNTLSSYFKPLFPFSILPFLLGYDMDHFSLLSHPDNDNLFQPPKPEPRSRFFSTRIFWFHSFCPGSTLLSSFGFHLLLLLRTIILLTSSLLLYFTFLVPMPSIFLFYCCCNKLQLQWFRTRQTYYIRN